MVIVLIQNTGPLDIAVGLLVVIGLPALFLTFFCFSKFVELEHRLDRSSWENDGRPTGFFWAAPDAGGLANRIAKQHLMWRCLFETPAWAKSSVGATVWLRRFRLCAVIWNATVVATAAVFLAGAR